MGKDKRIKRNLISSLVYQVVFVSLGFLLPRLYLENFGSEVNGVLSTLKQIFAYLVLLEAGVGLATTQALYKRIGERDFKSANEVLAATHSYYVKTGVVYAAIVLALAVVYAYVIPSSINSHELFFIVLLYALPALFSYFVQAKYRILMEVDGRKYVINNSETLLQLTSNVAKILLLFLTDSLILIQFSYCVINLIQLGYLYVYAKRRYKWMDLSVKPDFEAISQKNSVMVHQLSGMVFNNTDVILISVLCDFRAASIYAIYNIFFLQVQSFITSVVSSFTFALGQLFHVDRERFDRMFAAYESLYLMGTFLVYTLMGVFLLPLIRIYTSGINDADYLNPILLLLFVVMNLASNAKMPVSAAVEFAGEFTKTRTHAIWEMSLNLGVSIVAIWYFGICGALLGTIVALLYRGIVAISFTNKKILGRSVWQTYKCIVANGAVFVFVMAVLFVDTFRDVSFGKLILCGMLHSIWIVALYAVVNYLLNKSAISTVLEYYRGRKHEHS